MCINSCNKKKVKIKKTPIIFLLSIKARSEENMEIIVKFSEKLQAKEIYENQLYNESKASKAGLFIFVSPQ